MLNKIQFITAIQNTVFNQTDWNTAADNLAIAIDNYYKSGVVETSVTGTVTPPFPASPYTAYGKGKGSPVTTTLSTLKVQCRLAFQQTDWNQVGPYIASEINNLILNSTLNTTLTANAPAYILVGSGVGASITTPGSTALSTNLNSIFSQNNTIWDIIASDIADEVDNFIKQAVFTTNDNGSVPVNSWVGTGSGSITS